MANKSLTDLPARIATAGSDLLHINSGGTDYKQTKSNFMHGSLAQNFEVTSTLTSQVDALPIEATYFGCLWNYGHVSVTGMPINALSYVKAVRANSDQFAFIEVWSALDPDGQHYIICKNNGTWESSWTKCASKAEITSLNNKLANNGAIDGVRVVTAGANFRYIRIKRESASTSFYGLGLAIMYGNERSCIFSIGPSTPSIKPLGNQTPTGTYSYSSGVNTAVIDLGASGQGLVILGGTLGRSSNTTIELLASL